MPAYRAWSRRAESPFHGDVLARAIEQAISFATGEAPTIEASLLRAVEASTPGDPSGSESFTAAQDCWILADTALRVGLGEFDAADSAWYLLEPKFQATSERLVGVSDPGSVAQEDAEAHALADPQLSNAIGALRDVIGTLRERLPTRDLVATISSQLVALSP
jgi:hypothetical protein